jgi:hypothetical protein
MKVDLSSPLFWVGFIGGSLAFHLAKYLALRLLNRLKRPRASCDHKNVEPMRSHPMWWIFGRK